MDKRERVRRQALGLEVDRIPKCGGWMLGIENVAWLADLTVPAYLSDPWSGMLRANQRLGVDALITPRAPDQIDGIRFSHIREEDFSAVQPEVFVKLANDLPDTEAEVLASFDAEADERRCRESYRDLLGRIGDMALIPTHWDAQPCFMLYGSYGYEAYLSAIALYPDAVGKVYWADAVRARARNHRLVQILRDFDLPPVILCGQDICTGQGSMVAPRFLDEHYWPHTRRAIEPLLDAGIRLVFHCDGNVTSIVETVSDCGWSGWQGFQYEFGVDPYRLAHLRGQQTQAPLFLAGLSVTRTLPWGEPADAEAEVEWVMEYTHGGEGLFLFTSNVVTVEAPPQNLLAAYRHLDTLAPGWGATAATRPWPWSTRVRSCGSNARDPVPECTES